MTVQFHAHPLGTEVVVTHERIGDPRARDQHAIGWEGCLEGLATHAQGLPVLSPHDSTR